MKTNIMVNSFISKINNKNIDDIQPNIKNILLSIYNFDNKSIIKISKISSFSNILKLTINDKVIYLRLLFKEYESLYIQKINHFTNYLKNQNHSKEDINRLLFFFYGDLTINNTGYERYSYKALKEKFPNKYIMTNEYLNKCVFSDKTVDFLLFNDDRIPAFISYLIVYKDNNYYLFERNKTKQILLNQNYDLNNSLHIGPFVLTNLKRNIHFDSRYETKRLYLKIFWNNYFKQLSN